MAFTIVKADGTGLSFDATISEDYSPEIFVTNHPIEDGSNVSDHAQELPQNFSVRCMITFSPLKGVPNDNLVPVAGPQRVEVVLDFLKSCVGKLVIVQTTHGKIIRNCLLKKYPHTYDVRRAVYFDLQFQVARIATSQVIQIQSTKPKKSVAGLVSSKVDTGSNALEVCDPETDPKAALDVSEIKRSYAATIYDVSF